MSVGIVRRNYLLPLKHCRLLSSETEFQCCNYIQSFCRSYSLKAVAIVFVRELGEFVQIVADTAENLLCQIDRRQVGIAASYYYGKQLGIGQACSAKHHHLLPRTICQVPLLD